MFVVVMVFICSLLGFQLWTWDMRQKEDKANLLRYAETQSELSRQYGKQDLLDVRAQCKHEAAELRNYFADQDKRRDEREAQRDERRMKFEAEERAKDRAVIEKCTMEQTRWRELLRPVLGNKLPAPPDGEAELGCGVPLIAPMPRLISPSVHDIHRLRPLGGSFLASPR
jgi:hypothetical protein